MKYIFFFLILFHGLIHLLGFVKSIYPSAVPQLTKEISKPLGWIWLLTSILLLLAAILFMLNKPVWTGVALLGILLSQFLIFTSWTDARFGTVVNVIILICALPAYRYQSFLKNTEIEIQNFKETNSSLVNHQSISDLPPVVQKWLIRSGVTGNEAHLIFHALQKGQMRSAPNGKWMNFESEQFSSLTSPSFIWKVKVDWMSFLFMNGRDKLMDGKGEMKIQILGLLNVVDDKDNPKINTGSAIRYLAEICWFPPAALNKNIHWTAMDSNSAKAILEFPNGQVEGIFVFDLKGDLNSFTADRFYGGGKEAQKEKWEVKVIEQKHFGTFRIPSLCHINWKLKEGDFHWLTLEILQAEYQ
ncbi:MAG TPA: hypothetical protein PLN76_15205 [Saprospiraceae bacterium]|nr:hypothetical protein [Saprospiraceae bacterium]